MRRLSVVFNRGVGKSGRLLGAALGDQPKLVNWTGRNLEGALNGSVTTDKLAQLQCLRRGDVPVPEFSLRPREGWAGRSRFHTRGRDFQTPPARPDYWTKMYPSVAEWRMHVVRKARQPLGTPSSYEVFRTGKKIQGGPSTRGVEFGSFPIRSRDFGWTLKYWRTGTKPNGLRDAALASRWAVSCLGWDFGAVDLLEVEEGKFLVLEVNSCPSLRDEHTLAAYKERILALMEE